MNYEICYLNVSFRGYFGSLKSKMTVIFYGNEWFWKFGLTNISYDISNGERWNGKIRANFEVSSSLTLLWPYNTDSNNITFINGSLLHFCLFICNKYNECYECNKQNSRFINNSISNFVSSIYKVWKKNWSVLSHR